MKLLAIETSGFEGSVALLVDGELTERALSTQGRRHAQTLVLEIAEVLRDRGVTPGDVDIVAVSAGPGSFTGLRVGVVCAKTFAWANDCQLVAVDTLQATALRASTSAATVRVLMDAQRNEVFVKDFRQDPQTVSWIAEQSVQIKPVAEVAEQSQDVLLTGPGLSKFEDRFPDDAHKIADDLRLPTASAVAQVGFQQAGRGQLADIAQLEPVYIRRSYAEEKAAAAR